MTFSNKKIIDWKLLLMGIAIPTFFCILIQLSYILAKINSNFNVIFNLDTFTTIFLIFLQVCLL